MYWAGYIENLGSGLTDIRKECEKNDIPLPIIDDSDGMMRFSIRGKLTSYENNVSDESLNEPLNESLKIDGDSSALYLISQTPGLNSKQLLENYKKSFSTLKREIAMLIKAGKIEYRGSKKTGGYYLK